MQFRFRTCFEADIEFLPMAHNLFYNRTHLVDFDGIHDEILAFELIFSCRNLEAGVHLLDT